MTSDVERSYVNQAVPEFVLKDRYKNRTKKRKKRRKGNGITEDVRYLPQSFSFTILGRKEEKKKSYERRET